jgi:hypothetical protein
MVGDALTGETLLKGMRPPENLEVVDNREAREPGRSGDGCTGCWERTDSAC